MDMSIRFPGLGLSLAYVGKSVRILGLEISIYGILLALGMMAGFAVLVIEAKRASRDQNLCLMMGITALVAGTVGARLFYVIFSWPLYQDHLMKVFYVQEGGMSVYGAILGGLLGIALFAYLEKLSFWQMADFASIGFLTGQMIARWGDFFNRESFGEYNTMALAMQLPLSAVRSSDVTSLMREHLETVEGVSYIQVHPVFFYESAWCLLLLLFLLARKRKAKFEGEVCMRYLSGYGLGRFFIEWIRTDSLLIPGTRIAVGQIICAASFVLFALAVSIRRYMVKKREILRRKRQEAICEQEELLEAERDKIPPEEIDAILSEVEEEPDEILPEGEEPDEILPEREEEPDEILPEGEEEPDGILLEGKEEPDEILPEVEKEPDKILPEVEEEPDEILPEGEEPDEILPEVKKELDAILPEREEEPDEILPEVEEESDEILSEREEPDEILPEREEPDKILPKGEDRAAGFWETEEETAVNEKGSAPDTEAESGFPPVPGDDPALQDRDPSPEADPEDPVPGGSQQKSEAEPASGRTDEPASDDRG